MPPLRRIVITGGAGFIGSHLARRAVRADHDVVVVDDLSTATTEDLTGVDIDLRRASVLDPDALDAAFRGADSIVHLAALGSVPRSISAPLATHAANATGTLQVLERARVAGVRHVVVASSSSVYGMNPALPKSERGWVRPMSPYAVTKLATEGYALAYQQSFGLDTLAFRFFNVFGPGQRAGHAYAAVIPVFVDAMLSGRPVPLHGDGTQSRDFTFVATVCEVLLDAVERRVTHPEPVNLAFGTHTTLLTVLAELHGLTGIEPQLDRQPARPGDVRHSQADNATLRTLFPGVTPVPLSDGLQQTVSWFEGRGR